MTIDPITHTAGSLLPTLLLSQMRSQKYTDLTGDTVMMPLSVSRQWSAPPHYQDRILLLTRSLTFLSPLSGVRTLGPESAETIDNGAGGQEDGCGEAETAPSPVTRAASFLLGCSDPRSRVQDQGPPTAPHDSKLTTLKTRLPQAQHSTILIMSCLFLIARQTPVI